jgi:hypothetical protein
MVSDRKLAANRKNAKKSSGPKSETGKRRSARNALSHGLAVSIGNIAALRGEIETLALSIALANGRQAITESSRQAAEAQLDLLRIRKCRAAILTKYHKVPATETSYDELNESLARLERYERRAFSRRERALRST